MVRSLLVPVLVFLLLLAAAPTVTAGGGLYHTAAQIQVHDYHHEVLPGQDHVAHFVITVRCAIAPSGVDPVQHLVGQERLEYSAHSNLKGLEVALEAKEALLHHDLDECREVREESLANSITYRLTEDVPAFAVGTIGFRVDPEWGQPVEVRLQVRVGVAGTLQLDAPERVILDGAGEGSATLRLVNHYNTHLAVEPHVTLRDLIGSQPGVEPVVLAPGEAHDMVVPVRVADDPDRTGSLKVLLLHAPQDDPAAAFQPVTATIPVGAPGADDPALLNVAIEESPAPPLAGFVALLGLVLGARVLSARTSRR